MKVTYQKALTTANVIRSLPFLKKSPKANMAFAVNLVRLAVIEEADTATRRKLWTDIFGEEASAKNDDPKLAKLNWQMEGMRLEQVEFEASALKLSDINLDENALTPAQVAGISWLIEDFSK